MFLSINEQQRSFWLPPQNSNMAEGIDSAFMIIYWLSVICFVGIVGAMAWFVWKYRRKEGVEPPESKSHWLGLELTWTIIPLIIVFFLFYEGFTGFTKSFVAPSNSYPITVTAKKWVWGFLYPGADDNVLHVPANRPVVLKMTSTDVIHSLFIPDFRVKKDVIPGRYTSLWFEATEPGVYNLFCTEYCGQQHSDMITTVVVHPPLEEGKDAIAEKENYPEPDMNDISMPFEVWLAFASDVFRNVEAGNETLADVGETLFNKRGCSGCHSITADQQGKKGPPFVGKFGESIAMANGESVVRDENYLLESIKNPAAKVRAGYENVMPNFTSQFREEREYVAIVEYIKRLNGQEIQPASPAATDEAANETENSESSDE